MVEVDVRRDDTGEVLATDALRFERGLDGTCRRCRARVDEHRFLAVDEERGMQAGRPEQFRVDDDDVRERIVSGHVVRAVRERTT